VIAEINLFGVFFSGALVTACLAGIALVVIRYVSLMTGLHRLVWHRHLVDLSLFVMLWAAVAKALPLLVDTVRSTW
jgi:hypothetical protein